MWAEAFAVKKPATASAPDEPICAFGRGVYFISHLVIFTPFQHLQWSHLVHNRILGMHSSGLTAITSLDWKIAYDYMGQDLTTRYMGWKEPAIILSGSTVSSSKAHTGDWSTWSNKTQHARVASLVNCPAQLVKRPRTLVKELFVYHSKFYTMSIKKKKAKSFFKAKALLQN